MNSANNATICIRPFREEDLPAVVRLYNQATASIPFNWPVTDQEFRDEVIGGGRLCKADFPFDPVCFLVAVKDGEVLGFVHFARMPEAADVGLLRFLAIGDEQRAAGDILLNEAIGRLKHFGCSCVEAFHMAHGYPFYTSQHGGCWEQISVADLFLAAGFENYHREAVFYRDLSFGTSKPMLPHEVKIEKTANQLGYDELHLLGLRAEGGEVARLSWHKMNALCRHPSARNHAYVYHVSTDEKYQRRGLARLLLQEAFADMRAYGLRSALLHTMFDNVPAVALYTRLGFRCLGNNIILRKSLA